MHKSWQIASMYSCICLDLDGTLLNSTKQISAANHDAIVQLYACGRKLIIATGRHLAETKTILKQYELATYVSYIIYADGCYVYDCCSGKNIYTSLLKMCDVDTIIDVIGHERFVLISEDRDYEVRHYPVFRMLHRKTAIEKAVIYSVSEEKRRLLDAVGFFLLDTGPSVDVRLSNKSKALHWLLEDLGFSSEALLYFGDEFNDKDCFESFDSVVMGNAPLELKRYSIITAKTNDEDGVSLALKDLFG